MKKYFLFLLLSFFIQGLNAQEGKNDSIYTKVEIEATFPGGESKWINYIIKSLNLNVGVDNHAPPGIYRVMIQFIVGYDGSITEIKPLTTHGFGMEEEVIRVISNGPKWNPAMQGGKPVKGYRKQPVTFEVAGDFKLSTYTIPASKPTPVEIIVDRLGATPGNIEVTLSYGIIRHDSGDNYLITVDKPGRVLLSIKRKAKKKKDEEDYGTVAIEVK